MVDLNGLEIIDPVFLNLRFFFLRFPFSFFSSSLFDIGGLVFGLDAPLLFSSLLSL